MAKEKKREWSVFFLIKATGRSVCETIKMINEIRSIELNKHVSIVLCLNFAVDHLKPLLEGDEGFEPGTEETPLTTIFFEVVPRSRQETFLNDLRIILEKPKFDITDPVDIEKYLRSIVLKDYQAEHFLLFSWDHGRGYGIFGGGNSVDVPSINVKMQNDARMLSMNELRDAIQRAFGSRKIDIIIMMNCFMQMIETGYALRKVANYLVAPQTAMDFSGYNYHYIFQALINTPGLTPRRLAKLVVRSFPLKKYPAIYQSAVENAAVYATDLNYYSSLGKQVDKLVDHILAKLSFPGAIDTLMEIRERCFMDSSYNFVDFYEFVDEISNNSIFGDNKISNLILSIKDLVVLKSFKGNKIFSPSSGFSVFFPATLPSSTFPQKSDEFFKTDFMLSTKWIRLIEKIS